MASYSGGLFWRVILADYFGTSIWRVFMANETSRFQGKEKQKKRKENVYSVDL